MLDQRTLTFDFNDIHLVARSTDEALSQGFVSFSINTKANLANGSRIDNTASIYFDANSPIVTNTTTNHIMDVISATGDWSKPLELMFPNPVREVLCLQAHEINALTTLEVIDIAGQIAYTGKGSCHDVSKLAGGLWVARINTSGKQRLVKFIKL